MNVPPSIIIKPVRLFPLRLPAFTFTALSLVALASYAWLLPKSVDDLQITTSSESHFFEVEIATTPEEQAKGLMHRTSLGADEGMLFVYPSPVETAFWMKNTLIPLDMIFIDDQRKIVRITANTRPMSLTPRPAPSPVIGVLEINGGRAAELGIQVGDVVTHSELPE